MSPRVTVILPTYNRAHFLGEAIQSVLDQGFADLELLIIDDGSTDSTADLVKSALDPRIRYFYQDNRGISGARNAGLSHARGDLIAFLDSDDLWGPNLLQVQTSALDNAPEVGLAYAKAQAIDVVGNLRPQIRGTRERYPAEAYRSMLYGDFTCLQTTVVRRTCFENVGCFDESLKGRVDWDMFLRIARYYDFLFTDETLARFRLHEGQTTGKKSQVYQQVFESRLSVLDKAFGAADFPEELHTMRSLAYRNAYIDIGIHWLGLVAIQEATHSFIEAMRISGRPVATTARIVYLVSLYFFISQHQWCANLDSKIRRLAAVRKLSKSAD